MSDKPDDKKPVVTAQQAIEDFLFEMIPAHNELAERLAKQKEQEAEAKEKALAAAAAKEEKKQKQRRKAEEKAEAKKQQALKAEEEAFELARNAWVEVAEEIIQEDQLKQAQEQERLELERLEQERLEQERLEQERLEQERLEQERLEQERLEQERLEQERLEQERLEQERLEQERLEQARLENERLEQARQEQAESAAAKRLREQEQAEEDSFRIAAEHAEAQRREREQKINAQRLAQAQQEKQKQAEAAKKAAEKEAAAKEMYEQSARSQMASLPQRPDADISSKSLAAKRVEEKKGHQAVSLLAEVREPVSLEMKLIRARLASSFEDSGIAPRLVPPVVEAKPEQPVQEQPAPPAAEAKVKSKVQTTPAQQAPVEVEPPQPVVKKEQQPAIAKPVVDGSAKQPASQETAAEQGALEPPLDWTDEGRPVWASGRFECLLFTVAGLKLAVPLIALGSIHPIEEHFTPLVGRANWFMGLMPVQGRRLRVVDTALWVMPEKYRTEIRDNYQYVIRLGRSNWGIACDKVAQAITLKADEVRWRTQRSKRPWLAGTVVEYMCALMDVETFEYMLAESDRTGKPMQF